MVGMRYSGDRATFRTDTLALFASFPVLFLLLFGRSRDRGGFRAGDRKDGRGVVSRHDGAIIASIRGIGIALKFGR